MRKVDDLLQQFLDRIGQSDGAPYVGLFRGWRQIVGDRIADHAEPVDIRGTALIVEADHPGWVQMVMMSRTRILRQLNREFPELKITGMHIRISGQKAASSETRGATETADHEDERADGPPEPPSKDEKEALGRIDDNDLRDSLERLRQALDDDE